MRQSNHSPSAALSRSLLAVAMFCLTSTAATAKTIHVDLSLFPSGNEDGTSWGDAYYHLQDALAAASSGDTIYVAAATYRTHDGSTQPNNDPTTTFQLKNGVEILGGFPAGGGVRDPAANPTILSGDISPTNAYHVVTGSGTDATAILDGFVISGGNANGNGGGLFNQSGSPTIADCSFLDNQAASGGAIANSGASSPTLTNCSFLGNSTTGSGGVIFNFLSSPTLINCVFQGNQADSIGGAICNAGSSPSLINCSFQGNSTTQSGGAIANSGTSSPTFTNCIIWNNAAAGSTSHFPASVANFETSTSIFAHCIIANSGGSTSWNSSIGTDNGNNLDADPLFVAVVNPLSAPTTTGGDLRLGVGSSAVDVGDDSANTTLTDLGGNPRIQGTDIDLGVFEVQIQPDVHFVRSGGVDASNPKAGISWHLGFAHLHDALAAASSGDSIYVGAGTYTPDDGNDRSTSFQLKSGVEILGGFPSSGSTLAQRDPATHLTILSADLNGDDGANFTNRTDNAYHVLKGTGANATAILDGFTVSGGNADSGWPNNVGGGLLNAPGGSPTLRDCRFEGNQASTGGAIYNLTSASPTIIDCVFQGNKTSNNGAAIYIGSSSPTLSNCAFLDNLADNSGGAIFISSSSPTLTNCSLQGNQAGSSGGAIYNQSSSSPDLTNCFLQGNHAGSSGGAIFNTSSSPTLTNCSLQGNQADNSGGAIYNTSSSPTLTNCSLQGNQADNSGGAIYNTSSSPTLTNCSLQGNQAVSSGGAIYNSSSSPTLTNCILWNNAEGIAANTAGASVVNVSSSSPSYSHCLVANFSKANLDAGSSPNTNFDPADPLFLTETAPASAPSTAGDLRLGFGSPALDLGFNSANLSPTDLAGNPRIFKSVIDLGAFEQQGVTFYVDTVATNGTGNGSSWSNAFVTVQDALAIASAGDGIHVATGTYYPDQGTGQNNNFRSSSFRLINGVGLLGGFPSGGGARNPTAYPTILSGDIDGNDGGNFTNRMDNAYHVVTGPGTNATAILDGFIITAGNASFDGGGFDSGGGLFMDSGSLSLTNCIFRGNEAITGGAIYNNASSLALADCSFQTNSATSSGGAIFNESFSSAALTDCTFQGNLAGSGGGAIWNDESSSSLTGCSFDHNVASNEGGAIYNQTSSPTLTDCSFDNNVAGSEGGAIYNRVSSSPTLSACTFEGNQADAGGAIWNFDSSPILTDCTFTTNSVTLSGGAIYNFVSSPTLTGCSFDDNVSDDEGGAIWNENSSPNLINCSFQRNISGDEGGAIWNNNASPVLTGCSFDDNDATINGGAIYNQASSTPAFTTCTFDDNQAVDGGAIWNNDSSPTFTNCTFVGNSTTNQGGAIYNTSASSPALTACSFQNNQAEDGGAVYNTVASSPSLTNCSFQSNLASRDGGAINNSSASSDLINCSFQGNEAGSRGGAIINSLSFTSSFINCSLQGNKAGSNGGAIYNSNSTPSLTNCSIQGNQALLGGAIYNSSASSPALTNCILWNNAEGNSINTPFRAIFNDPGSIPTYSHCLVQNRTASELNDPANSLDGTNPDNAPLFVAEVDPLSAPSTGGDLRIGIQSPAHNAGDNSANSTLTDLDGNPRVHGMVIELGAYEIQENAFFVRQDGVSSSVIGAGSSWDLGLGSIQDALAAASSGDTILVSAGTYYPDKATGQSNDNRNASFQLKNGVEILGGFPAGGGGRSLANSPTILSGDIDQNDTTGGDNSSNAYHVVNGSGTDATAILDGFIITAGNANGGSPQTANGGGFYNASGSPSLRFCRFEGNQANGGGAIYNVSSASPTFINSVIQGNKALLNGGAIFNDASSFPTLTNCSLQGNQADSNGGAIYSQSASSPALTNCILWDNAEGSNTNTPGASVVNADSSFPSYSHCLVQNWTAGALNDGINSLDGTDPANDPLFVTEVDSASAPTTGGDLRLVVGSLANDAGLNSANLSPTDLAGNPRIFNTDIDLGAFEQQTVIVPRYVDLAATGGSGNGSSWTDAFLTVQDALAAASSGDIFYVAAGTYYPDQGAGQINDLRFSTFQLTNGVSFVGGFPSGGSAFALRDPAANPTILSGDIDGNGQISNNAYHVVTGSGTDATAVLDGFVITAGYANGLFAVTGTHETSHGGGLYNVSGSPSIIDCSFQGNHSDSVQNGGGAIYNVFSSATFINCSFENNSATVNGGAIHNRLSSPALINCSFTDNAASNEGGAIFNDESSPVLSACMFSLNVATNFGGAIYNKVNSSPTLSNCSFMANQADDGGAIYNRDNSSPTLTNCSFVANQADDSGGAIGNVDNSSPSLADCSFADNDASRFGGAIYNSSSSPTLTDCSFSDNDANFKGGAIYNGSASLPALTNCTFDDNQADDGGAIQNRDNSSPTLTNCSFAGNLANEDGGAIHNETSASPVLTNCSIQGNKAGSLGGAIYNFNNSFPELINCSLQGNQAGSTGGAVLNLQNSTPTLTNCILWNNAEGINTNTAGASIASFSSSSPIYSHCLVQNWTAIALNDATNSLDGTSPANDPLFVTEVNPLSAPTTGGDLQLGAGSPALDVGLNFTNTTPFDLVGAPRIQNGIIDLGAYEFLINIAGLWATDDDGDGNPWGVEHALGTDIGTADLENPANFTGPSFNASGHASFTFGRNAAANADTIWLVTRSASLAPANFQEIFRFHGPSTTETNGAGVTSAVGASSISVTDTTPPVDKAFYRFEAIFVP